MAFDFRAFPDNKFVSTPPLRSASPGTIGSISVDGSFLYYCDLTNHWLRTTLTNFNSWISAFSGTLHLAADTLTLSDSASVTSWTDTSPSANTPTEATNPPTFKTNIVNGLPVVRFDGTNDLLTFPNALSSGNLSVFVVTALGAPPSSQNAYACFIIGGPTTGSPRVNARLSANSWGSWNLADITSGDNLVSGEWNILEVVSSVSSSFTSLYRNGVLKTTIGVPPDAGGATQKIIGQETGFTRFVNADIAEIIIFNSVLSETNRTFVERFLGSKYGIALG